MFQATCRVRQPCRGRHRRLGARKDITTVSTAQTNRLRALPLAGDDTDRRAARGGLTDTVLRELASRTLSPQRAGNHAVRQAEIQWLALALRQAWRQLDINRKQLLAIVDDIAAGLTAGGVSDRSAPPKRWSASLTRAAAATRPRSPPWAAPTPFRPASPEPRHPHQCACVAGSTTQLSMIDGGRVYVREASTTKITIYGWSTGCGLQAAAE